VQLALQAVQRVVGVGHRDKFHGAQFGTQIAGNIETADGQVSHAFEQHFLDAGQHLFTQTHATAAALRHKGGQGTHQPGVGVGSVDHQAHLGFPALFHVMGEVFELAGLLDQLPRAAQQHAAGLGQHRLAAVNAQQRHAELILHAGHGVAD